MQKFEEVFTPEQLEKRKSSYIVINDKLYPLSHASSLAAENLRIVDIENEVIVTADDITSEYMDFFAYLCNGEEKYILKNTIPEAVKKIIRDAIAKRKVEKTE